MKSITRARMQVPENGPGRVTRGAQDCKQATYEGKRLENVLAVERITSG